MLPELKNDRTTIERIKNDPVMQILDEKLEEGFAAIDNGNTVSFSEGLDSVKKRVLSEQ